MKQKKYADAAETFINSLSPADKRDLGVDKELVTSMYRDYALSNKVYEDITGDINPEISDDEARRKADYIFRHNNYDETENEMRKLIQYIENYS